jgi:hypothetical protein
MRIAAFDASRGHLVTRFHLAALVMTTMSNDERANRSMVIRSNPIAISSYKGRFHDAVEKNFARRFFVDASALSLRFGCSLERSAALAAVARVRAMHARKPQFTRVFCIKEKCVAT